MSNGEWLYEIIIIWFVIFCLIMKCIGKWIEDLQIFQIRNTGSIFLQNRVGFRCEGSSYIFIQEALWLFNKNLLLLQQKQCSARLLLQKIKNKISETQFKQIIIQIMAYFKLRSSNQIIKKGSFFVNLKCQQIQKKNKPIKKHLKQQSNIPSSYKIYQSIQSYRKDSNYINCYIKKHTQNINQFGLIIVSQNAQFAYLSVSYWSK